MYICVKQDSFKDSRLSPAVSGLDARVERLRQQLSNWKLPGWNCGTSWYLDFRTLNIGHHGITNPGSWTFFPFNLFYLNVDILELGTRMMHSLTTCLASPFQDSTQKKPRQDLLRSAYGSCNCPKGRWSAPSYGTANDPKGSPFHSVGISLAVALQLGQPWRSRCHQSPVQWHMAHGQCLSFASSRSFLKAKA